MIICCNCGCDLDKVGHCNISPFVGFPLCEDCGKDKDIIDLVEKEYQEMEYYK